MKGTTKPKGFGIAAAVLLAVLLVTVAIVPAMVQYRRTQKNVGIVS